MSIIDSITERLGFFAVPRKKYTQVVVNFSQLISLHLKLQMDYDELQTRFSTLEGYHDKLADDNKELRRELQKSANLTITQGNKVEELQKETNDLQEELENVKPDNLW